MMRRTRAMQAPISRFINFRPYSRRFWRYADRRRPLKSVAGTWSIDQGAVGLWFRTELLRQVPTIIRGNRGRRRLGNRLPHCLLAHGVFGAQAGFFRLDPKPFHQRALADAVG
jgi:hypothetical protein